MTAGDRYATPAAFRRALMDRLSERAKEVMVDANSFSGRLL